MDRPTSPATPAVARPLLVGVDDDPAILRALRRALRKEPVDVLLTAHPGDVLRWVCERPVDLVLADQRMPDLEGTDLLEVVRDYSPNTACVLLSGFPEAALVVDRAAIRIEHFLAKPWDDAELAGTVHRILEERTARRAESPARRGDATPTPQSQDLEFVIDCSGRAAREVLAVLLPICSRARALGCRPSVVLGNLPLLQDSVVRLIKGLARAAARSPSSIVLREESGCYASFLSALGPRATAHA